MSTILDMFKDQKITAKQTVIARLLMCSCFCVLGLFMTTRVSFMNSIFQFKGQFQAGFLRCLFIWRVDFLSSILLTRILRVIHCYLLDCWKQLLWAGFMVRLHTMYLGITLSFLLMIMIFFLLGADRFCADVECMVGKRSKHYWWAWKLSWKYLCPLVLAVIKPTFETFFVSF